MMMMMVVMIILWLRGRRGESVGGARGTKASEGNNVKKKKTEDGGSSGLRRDIRKQTVRNSCSSLLLIPLLLPSSLALFSTRHSLESPSLSSLSLLQPGHVGAQWMDSGGNQWGHGHGLNETLHPCTDVSKFGSKPEGTTPVVLLHAMCLF